MRWSPQQYSRFGAQRLRPAADLLARVPALAAAPKICDVGCGDGGPAKLLLERFPDAVLRCTDSSEEMLSAARAALPATGVSAATVNFALETFDETFGGGGGDSYDLVYANAAFHWATCDMPALLTRVLGRVNPAGCLAMQIPDTRVQPSHVLLREVAADLGFSRPDEAPQPNRVQGVPTNTLSPAEYCDALLGPLCSSLDMWTTTYVQTLEGDEPVYNYVRSTGMGAVLGGLPGGPGGEAARAFEAEYRRRALLEYPARPDGSTLFPFTRFFLVARRPSLVDVYAEYMEYHDHQLDKGWKS